jgi:hypothetical protein
MKKMRAACMVLVERPDGSSPLGRPRRRRENNTKWIFRIWNEEVWTGYIWLRTGTGGGLL